MKFVGAKEYKYHWLIYLITPSMTNNYVKTGKSKRKVKNKV